MSEQNKSTLIALDPMQIKQAVSDAAISSLSEITVLPNVDSTNSYLLEQPAEIGKAMLCAAEAQSAGRGRRGNEWQSASDRNIMMSMSWGFDEWPDTISGLSLAVAVVIAERLNQKFDINVTIKWPNDLLVDDAKLAGILIDLANQQAGVCKVVMGIGLNVSQPEWSRSETDYLWQDLEGLGMTEVDRNELIGQMTSDLIELFREFAETGLAPLVSRWNALSAYQNRRICVGQGESFVQGVLHGVDEQGALLIQADNGEIEAITDSNLSVRLV